MEYGDGIKHAKNQTPLLTTYMGDCSRNGIYKLPDEIPNNRVIAAMQTVFREMIGWVFAFFSILLGVPLAIVFGLLVPLLASVDVFLCGPMGRILKTIANWAIKPYEFLIRSLLEPFAKAWGAMYSRIDVKHHRFNNTADAPANGQILNV